MISEPTLTKDQLRKLEALRLHSTRYELILTNGTLKYRVGYTARHSQVGAHNLANRCFDEINAITPRAFMGKQGDIATDAKWLVLFSGRTQREAIMEGELVWIGSKTLREVSI